MKQPHTRQELLIAARTQYDALWDSINALPAAAKRQDFPFAGRDRNLRDVLVHLSAWQKMYLRWSQINLAGQKVVRFLPVGYTWATCGQLSQALQAANQDLSLAAATQRLRRTHAQLIAQLEDLQQEQLFIPGFYPWTGKAPLGAYATLFSVTRYHWARRVLHHANVVMVN